MRLTKIIFLILSLNLFQISAWAHSDTPPNLETLDIFNQMSAEDQAKFLEIKNKILDGAEKFLQKSRPILKTWKFMANGYSTAKEILYGSEQDQPSEEIKIMIRQHQQDFPELYERKSLNEQLHSLQNQLLETLEMRLWSQAPLVANTNEFSIIEAAASMQAQAGTNKNPYGGLLELGFGIAYNRDLKAVVFQIFTSKEKFIRTMLPVVAIGGIQVKIGPKIRHVSPDPDMESVGESFYPPGTPGFKAESKNSYWFGFSSGLTLPPPPFGDLLTYTNSFHQKTLIRVWSSSLITGFFRFKIDLGFMSFVKERIEKYFPAFANRPVQCRALF